MGFDALPELVSGEVCLVQVFVEGQLTDQHVWTI